MQKKTRSIGELTYRSILLLADTSLTQAMMRAPPPTLSRGAFLPENCVSAMINAATAKRHLGIALTLLASPITIGAIADLRKNCSSR
jgi:hypothetical protein